MHLTWITFSSVPVHAAAEEQDEEEGEEEHKNDDQWNPPPYAGWCDNWNSIKYSTSSSHVYPWEHFWMQAWVGSGMPFGHTNQLGLGEETLESGGPLQREVEFQRLRIR